MDMYHRQTDLPYRWVARIIDIIANSMHLLVSLLYSYLGQMPLTCRGLRTSARREFKTLSPPPIILPIMERHGEGPALLASEVMQVLVLLTGDYVFPLWLPLGNPWLSAVNCGPAIVWGMLCSVRSCYCVSKLVVFPLSSGGRCLLFLSVNFLPAN